MNDPIRLLVVAALTALAVVALAAAIALVVVRSRSRLRAPLAGALTFALLALAAAAGVGVIAGVLGSAPLAAAATVPLVVAAISIARVGLLRREHPALIGGSAAVEEARAVSRATLRAIAASTRLAERLDGVDGVDDIDALLLDAARRGLPDAVITLGVGDVEPTGKVDPDAGVHVAGSVPSMMSL